MPSDNVPFNEKPDMKAREIAAAAGEALRSGKFDQVRGWLCLGGVWGVWVWNAGVFVFAPLRWRFVSVRNAPQNLRFQPVF